MYNLIMAKFEELYKKLNKAQKEAVDAVDGPVMVVAGPGTGKTQILTLRIANILKKTDTEPENILALTFTESGVSSMRRRLVEIIGTPGYSVVISTFHGFCNDVIKNYPEEFPAIIGSQNITEVDQINIIEKAIDGLPLKDLKPFGDPLYYTREILKSLNDLKREGLSPEGFKLLVEKEEKDFTSIDDLYHEKGAHKGKMKGEYQKIEKQIRKNKELAVVYGFYQKQLAENKMYDYSDMIMEVLRELSQNQNLLLILQEQHQYMLVDEHQDTNNAQNKVLELLCNFHPNPNIFVVGDEKLAIFRFQGASIENFLYFKNLYPKARLIVLEDNYRSTQNILDSAHSILAGDKQLQANMRYEEEKIRLLSFSKPKVEAYFVAKSIKNLISKGVVPSEIAILYRDNKDVFTFADMLERVDVPFAIESDQDILSDPDIKKLMLIMRLVDNFGSQARILESMHIDFLGIDPLDVYKIINYSNKEKIPVHDIVKHKKNLERIDLESADKIHDFYKKVAGWATIQKNQGLSEFFELMINESGFLAHIMKEKDVAEKMQKLDGLFNEIKSLLEKHKDYDLRDFIKYIDTLQIHNLLIKKSLGQSGTKNIRLMTAHRSKGQEFEYVYIVNAFDGHWGNKRRTNLLSLPASVYSLGLQRAPLRGALCKDKDLADDDGNDDERRLFYVAITRAKKLVTITYAQEALSGKQQIPSQFIQEIKSDLIETVVADEYEDGFERDRTIMFTPKVKSGTSIKDKEFIKDLFTKNGLSVTSLNNYLRCPWQYFYTNLLRIPKAKDKHQMYGTAIHGALKDFFDKIKEGEANKEMLLSKFVTYLQREPLKESDFEEVLQKGEKSLSGYYDNYVGHWRANLLNEFNIPGIVVAADVRITGKIDKIEILNDSGEVNVVDYKTGRQKTRGEIEGTTQTSNGDIKRQLVFYNLLLNNYAEGKKFKMISGDIDFIEPDEKGRYKKESFYVTSDEVVELKELVIKTSQEIMNLDFWDKGCKEKDCEYCALRKMME